MGDTEVQGLTREAPVTAGYELPTVHICREILSSGPLRLCVGPQPCLAYTSSVALTTSHGHFMVKSPFPTGEGAG